MLRFFKVFYFITLLTITVNAQEIRIGSDLNAQRQTQGAYFDYSDPQSLNITVSVWGNVRYPGYYVIPSYLNAKDLLSLSGGPTDAAHLEDLRIYRSKNNESQELIKFDYNDLMWNENIEKIVHAPTLEPGDIFVVPGSPRFYFKDYFSITLSIISTLISLTILILNITR